MYLIKHLPGKPLFYVEITGKINHEQIIEFLGIISENNKNCKELYLITDYRNAIINETSIDPIEKIGLFINTKMKVKFEHIRWANLSFSHLPTTGALLLYEIIKGKGIEYEPFTTIERAYAWISLLVEDIDKLIILND